MKPFFNSRVKRNTAFMVIFTWLFALASGAVNACLIEPRGTHTEGSAVTLALAMEEAEEAETPDQVVGAVGHHHHDSDAPGTPCQKVCDEGSNTLPKQQSTSTPTDSGLAPLFAVAWAASEIRIAAAPIRAHAHAPPRPRLSVRVLFSRLAI